MTLALRNGTSPAAAAQPPRAIEEEIMHQHEDNTRDIPSIWYRLALASGLAFAALMFAAGFVFSVPRIEWGGSGEAVRAWLEAHAGTSLVNSYLQAAAGACFIFFATGLYSALRRAEGGGTVLALASLAGGVATGVMGYVRLAHALALVRYGRAGGPADVLQALDISAYATQEMLAFTQGIFWLAASLAMVRTRVAPRWIGVLGLVGSAALFVSTATVLDEQHPLGIAGFVVFVLFTAWMLATTISLLLRSRTRRPAGQAQLVTA